MVKPRRETLDILQQQQDADEAALEAIKKRIAERDLKIDPLQGDRTAKENEYLGAIARVLVADDTALKRRFVQQAAQMFPAKATHPRRNLQRVIGKIPVIESEPTGKPDSLMDAAAE
jgi:hypothetical protein